MKIVFLTLGLLIVGGAAVGLLVMRSALAGGASEPTGKVAGTLWDFSTSSLAGEPVALEAWRGQVALVVNTASKCGLTPQYEGLEALYRARKDEGFVILGFPSNDFMGQEPGTAEEIAEFCRLNYEVSFPLMAKVPVKGENKSEIYRWLTAGGLEEPTWNFTKYLVGRDGQVIARFGPRTKPDDPQLVAAVTAALAAPGS